MRREPEGVRRLGGGGWRVLLLRMCNRLDTLEIVGDVEGALLRRDRIEPVATSECTGR